ncbi:methyl-accepting chemotaxis protein [Alteromonas sp. 1_MG-2023]|uniref:methyl-accepting chemotaxis protein n=1 Tax=Alteromonas sp. 1_MG-2023 TaxID=3062669 RepID=UPI0026E114D5|nr:methyl-accepting chemotaxis protein [Alteromonas sp. 1_MG-2023]MDO6566957.1 methyl-accepting chemotaxis protein [Alteromonas sp. 1_MG-2023]
MQNMTIRHKLFVGFGLVLLMMVTLVIIGIQKVNFIDATLTEISDVNSVKQRYAINYRGSVHDRAIDIRDIVLATNNAEIAALENNVKKLESFYRESEQAMEDMIDSGVIFTAEETRILNRIAAIQETTSPLMQHIISLMQQGNTIQAKSLLSSDVGGNIKQWLAAINAFIDYQEEANKIATPKARDVAGDFQYLMIVITSIAGIIGISVTLFISRNLTNQLGAEPSLAASTLVNMTSGDLTTPINNCFPDSLMGSVVTMREKLRAIVTSIFSSATELAKQANRLSTDSKQAYDAAQVQAALTNETTDSLNTMRQGMTSMSESMSQSEVNSAKTSELTKLGKDKIEESAREMNLISSTVSKTVGQIKQLQDRTKEIGSIVSVIGSISDQTNLLALNAAIEAARAGESGRGFAVVADEVRNLSLRTGEATQQIAKMINEVQSETAASVLAMEETQPLVENGHALTIETIALLLNIEQQANDTLLNVQEVASATIRQVELIEKISNSMSEINTMTVESISALQRNNEATQSLDALSQELKSTVSFFKIS